MKAMVVREYGGPDVLQFDDVPAPKPGPGEVRLNVAACGVNFADTLIIQGKYQEKPPFPFSPGMEVSGTIDAVGADVADLAPGDRVVGMCGFGGFAEQVVCAAARCVKIPESLGFVEAAAFPVAYGTSHVALTHKARLKAGEVLLVHGAGGGVGLTAVEIGKTLGATVIATARGEKKLAAAKAKGADHLIDTDNDDIRTRVKEITDGAGADVVYDPVGGAAFDASLRAIAFEGRLIIIGFASGDIPQIPANILLVKNVDALGLYWGSYNQKKPKVIADSFRELLAWQREGRIQPEVRQRFSLLDAPEALRALIERRITGKAVLEING